MYRNKSAFAIHPFMFGIYPILFLYSHNIGLVSFSEILLPLGLVTLSTVILLFLLALFIKNGRKAAVIVSLLWAVFFSFGHILDLIRHLGILKEFKDFEYYLFGLWIIFLALATVFALRRCSMLINTTKVMNIIAAALICFTLVNIGVYWTGAAGRGRSFKHIAFSKVAAKGKSSDSGTLPDIYYIILDGYADSRTLKELFHFNNAEFVNFLTGRGFFVAFESRSNYASTFLSLASSLNLTYINELGEKLGIDSKSPRIPIEMIEDNAVMRYLKGKGYTIIHLRSGSSVTNRNRIADLDIDLGTLDEFKILLAKTTMLRAFLKELDFFGMGRKRILNTLARIPQIAGMNEATFTFAHILIPHPPYLFDRQGRPVQESELEFEGNVWKKREDYVNQLVFLNRKIEKLTESVLAKSKSPPVIILQADHGTASLFGPSKDPVWEHPTQRMLRERFRIFNAYLLPDKSKTGLYDGITPVNTFRVIFNTLFGGDFQLLDDRSYYSTYTHPYRFYDVTEKVRFP